MLEISVNQAAALQGLAGQAAPRLMALASHTEPLAEMSLLWGLCATLVSFEQPVVVLDGSSAESATNPGLMQILQPENWPGVCASTSASCAVIPARVGLGRLCAQALALGSPLHRLGGLWQGFGAVIVYASGALLSQLLQHSGVAPMVLVADAELSALSAYQAIKQMRLQAQLEPVIVNLVDDLDDVNAEAASAALHKLQHCAKVFLNYTAASLVVHVDPAQEVRADDIQRLALQLLEQGVPLYRNHFVGSH